MSVPRPAKLTPGLVSVTFRKLSPTEIIRLARDVGLQAIEWGGDFHVPHGNLAMAAEVSRATEDAGLVTSAYGSYYRAGVSESEGLPFLSVLETAAALRAPAIRVWAGNSGSADCPPEKRAHITADLDRISALAASHHQRVTLEFHGHTLTDTLASTRKLLAEVHHPNLFSSWQPPQDMSVEEAQLGLTALLPLVEHVHVFHWWPNGQFVHPLADGAFAWKAYLKILAAAPRDLFISLEFVRGESVQQFTEDASTLLQWLEKPQS